MTTPSPTASPTLRTDWGQTVAGCLRTDDYWIWDYDGAKRDARTVLGGPSQTTNCFASSWDPTVTFAGSGCPPQYTSACHNTKSGAVTCCPSAYDFSCQPETWTPGYNHAEWFRCVSEYGNRNKVIVTRTDLRQNTLAVGTRTRAANGHLFALALMYTTPPSTSPSPTTSLPTSSSDSSTTSTPSPEKASSGLSPGAAAGVGVGVAAVVILLGLLAWFLYRRRKTGALPNEISQFSTPAAPSMAPTAYIPQFSAPVTQSVAPTAYTYATEESRGVSSLTGHSPDPSQYSAKAPIRAPPKELSAEEVPRFELDGDSNIHQYRRG